MHELRAEDVVVHSSGSASISGLLGSEGSGSKSVKSAWTKWCDPISGTDNQCVSFDTAWEGLGGEPRPFGSLVHTPCRPKATPRLANSSYHLSCRPLWQGRPREEQFLQTGLVSSHLTLRSRQDLHPVLARRRIGPVPSARFRPGIWSNKVSGYDVVRCRGLEWIYGVRRVGESRSSSEPPTCVTQHETMELSHWR